MRNFLILILLLSSTTAFAGTVYYRANRPYIVDANVYELTGGPTRDGFSGQKKLIKRAISIMPGQMVVLDEKTKSLKVYDSIAKKDVYVPIPEEVFKSRILTPQDSNSTNDADWLRPAGIRGKGNVGLLFNLESSAESVRAPSKYIPLREAAITAGENKPRLIIQDSKVVNFGDSVKPDYRITHKVCLPLKTGEKKCGWTRGDYVTNGYQIPAQKSTFGKDTPMVVMSMRDRPEDAYLKDNPAAPKRKIVPVTPECPPGDEAGKSVIDNRKVQAMALTNLSQRENDLKKFIGVCAIAPKGYSAYNGQNIYAAVAQNKVIAQLPNVQRLGLKKDNGAAITKQDLIDIDVLARTIYGEMESCNGRLADVQYMQGVAKVITNRVSSHLAARKSDPETDLYAGGAKSSQGGLISKVSLSRMQFSVWNNMNHGGSKSVLDKVLCPPRPAANPNAQIAWDQAQSVAIETVLRSGEFNRKTSGLSARYYTSDYVEKGKAKPTTFPWNQSWQFVDAKKPVVNGAKLDNGLCARFWDKTPRRKVSSK